MSGIYKSGEPCLWLWPGARKVFDFHLIHHHHVLHRREIEKALPGSNSTPARCSRSCGGQILKTQNSTTNTSEFKDAQES